jgi:hypothetical protein
MELGAVWHKVHPKDSEKAVALNDTARLPINPTLS